MSKPQERINASTITEGVVIAVERRGEFLRTTRRRTDVLHATVTGKTVVDTGERQRRYAITTDMGDIEPCPGIQTFPLISRPTVPAGAPDAEALVVAGTVVAMVERHDLVTDTPATCTDKYGHTPGTPGCPVTVRDCNGVPTQLADVITEQPARTDNNACGADMVASDIAAALSYRYTVTDVRTGYSDPARNRGVREVSTWSMLVDGHRVTVVRYEGRGNLMSTVQDHAMVLVDGEQADRVAPANLAQGTARTVRDYLADLANAAPIGPDIPPAPAVDQVDTVPATAPAGDWADLFGADVAPAPAVVDTVPAIGSRVVVDNTSGRPFVAILEKHSDPKFARRGWFVVKIPPGARIQVTGDLVKPAPAGAELGYLPTGDQVDAGGPDVDLLRAGTVRVQLINAGGDVVRDWTRPTWNSGIRDSEREIRRIALEEGAPYHGAAPARTGEAGTVTDTYRRVWKSSYGELTAVITRPVPAFVPTQGPATVPAVDQVAPAVTIEERPSGTPRVEPSADAPYSPPAPAAPDTARPDVPAGMPYVVDAPWDGPVTRLEPKQVAAMLRGKAGFLAAWFPGVRFSVKTGRGCAIDVSWSGGPAADLVDLVAKMWQGKDRDSQAECDRYRGTVLYVAPDGTETAYKLPGEYVFTRRERDASPAELEAARAFVPADPGREFTYGEVADPYGRPFYGGTADEAARMMVERGVTEWTRRYDDPRPVCPVERCAEAAGHPYPGMHRTDMGWPFLATLPAGDDDQGDGGTGGTPTDVDPVGPAPAGDQVDEPSDGRPSFRTWEELAAWIGTAGQMIDRARYAVTPPVDVPTWSAPAAPAVTVSFTCAAHGAVPVPVDIDSPAARSIRLEHQACTAGDPFGMRAIEQTSTPAARMARTLAASGWTPEEIQRVNDVRPLYTVTNDGHGRVRVHAVTCQDIARDVRRAGVTVGDSWEVRADHVRDVVCDLYDDATPETWREFHDVEVMPCADLDESDDAPAVAEETEPAITVKPWVTAHVDQVPAVQLDDATAPAETPVGEVRVSALVGGERVHLVGVDQFGSPTHCAGYVQGPPGEVTVPGRTAAGRRSKSASKSRPGLVVALAENPNGWNGWRMTVVTTPDAMAEHVTDSAHQFRPGPASLPHLVTVACSCKGFEYPGETWIRAGRNAWLHHANEADAVAAGTRTVVTMAELENARRLGAEAHEFGCPAAYPNEDAEFLRLVRELPAHIAPRPLEDMYCRGYAERAEREAARLEQSQEGRRTNLAVAERVAELNPATQWAVDSQRAAIESAGRTLAGHQAQAVQARALAGDVDEPAEDADQGGAGTIYTAPNEWYVPAVASDKGGDIVIMHDHEDGTVLLGSSRGDGVYEIARTKGFERRSTVGIFIPHSRDQFAQMTRIRELADALRLAGHTVTVLIDDVWRPAAVREEARGARVTARVERLTARSLKHSAAGDARRNAARNLMDGMPFGEPIKIGHHSETAHRRAFDRIESNQRAAHAAYDYAQHLAARADDAATNEDAKQGPRAIMRRIERLEADHREATRRIDEATEKRAAGSLRYWWLNRERIAEDIAYQRAKLGDLAESGAFVAWGPAHFQKDDLANVGGRWFRVVRVSAKSLSLDGLYTPGYVERAKWDRVHGRRRDGVQLDTPNGKPRDIDQAKRVERWESLMRSYRCTSYTRSPEEDSKRRNLARAIRVTLGLPRTATAQEVAAFGEPAGEEQQHARALALLAAFERLEAGETFDQVATDTAPLGDTAPAWTMPAGEPERVNVRDLVAGDIVCGIFDNFAGQGERLVSSMVGPVTAPAVITDRRESGEWYSLEVNGETFEGKTFRRIAAHLIGAR